MLLTRSEDLWSEVGVCSGGFVSGSAGANKVKKSKKTGLQLQVQRRHVGWEAS
jgi:hypothetical protein